MYKKTILSAIGVAILVMSSGCGSSQSSAQSWTDGGSSEKLAESSSAYIKSALANGGMDQSQVDMLNRALEYDGQVQYGDYVAAWSNYQQCLVNKGYQEPPLTQVNNLIVSQTSLNTEGLSEAQQEKISQDLESCKTLYVTTIDTVYKDNLTNPDLYQDQDVALVDCLHRNNLVSTDYTVKQYQQERDAYYDKDPNQSTASENSWEALRANLSFDFSDQNVRNCIVANASDLLGDQLEDWKPLG